MKKILSLIAIGALAATAQATTFTFAPTTADLFDLDHSYAYKWGVDATLSNTLRSELVSGGKKITSATLTIKNIYDWQVETTDILNINLFDDTKTGIEQIWDNSNGDYFGSTGWLTSWSDPVGGHATGFNFVYSFSTTNLSLLTSYLVDATSANKSAFGLGFDPDCHYYNEGIKLVVTTAPKSVPEGGLTVGLLGLGLVALAGVRRRIRS